MIDGKKIIAWIPARGGSKGIKDKNILNFQGKPLIVHTIEAALKSKYIDKVMVSTDSEKIAEIAVNNGAWVPFLRPNELAEDTSKTIDAVMHTLHFLNDTKNIYYSLCLLQPTSPLRDSDDIDSAILVHRKNVFKSVVSVSPVSNHPLLIRSIGNDGKLKPIFNCNSTCRRQDMPAYYFINGGIYINKISDINAETSFGDNEIPYIMKASHSVDVDDTVDLLFAELYISHKLL